MATAFSTIQATPAASPAPIALPTPANDTIGCWTADPRVARILASCAKNPPKGEWKRVTYVITRDEYFTYAGYRFEALTAIRDEYGERAHRAYMAHGDAAFPQFNAWCRSPSVVDTIDAVLPWEA